MDSQQKCAALNDPSSPEVHSGLAGIRVFIAEDEPILLMALEEVLEELGCRVVGTAGRVSDALAFVADRPFDIALLDGKLADGLIDPVIEQLVTRGTPFIVASGMATSCFSETFGNAIVLQKPYTDELLKKALIRALAQGPVLRKSR